MRIDFELSPQNQAEQEVVPDFIDYIIKNIRYDIYKSLDAKRCQLYEEDLLKASWIVWIHKPTSIDVINVIYYILRNLTCIQHDNGKYTIQFKNRLLPNTRTFMDAFIRFLDKGNEVSPPMYIFSTIFNKYRTSLNTYWREYVYAKTANYPESKVIS